MRPFLLGISSTVRCVKAPFSPNLHPDSVLKSKHSGKCNFYKMDQYKFLENVPCMVDETFSHTDFSSKASWISLNFSTL